MTRLADALIYLGSAAVTAAAFWYDIRCGIATCGGFAIAAGVLIALRKEPPE
jgi:hypothetical protein